MSNKVSRAFSDHVHQLSLVSFEGLGYNAHNVKHHLYILYALCLLNGHYPWPKQSADAQYRQSFRAEEEL